MKKCIIFCLLAAVLLFSLPQITFGIETVNNEVGIGFKNGPSQPGPKDSVENVPPMTNDQSNGHYQGAQLKRLPQTGDRTSMTLRLWGSFCLILVFWLFLFRQLREEEENE